LLGAAGRPSRPNHLANFKVNPRLAIGVALLSGEYVLNFAFPYLSDRGLTVPLTSGVSFSLVDAWSAALPTPSGRWAAVYAICLTKFHSKPL